MDRIPELTEPQEVSTSQQQTILNAAALGWGISELLGRCFALKEAPPAIRDWTAYKLVAFQENYTPREKIRALMVYIRFLADSLGVSSATIDHEGDSENGRPYVDVLEEKVRKFIQRDLPASGETREQLRGQINEHLFFWDLKLLGMLQSRLTVVHQSYMVGRSLASLRWYIGMQNKMPGYDFMQKICYEYVPLMQPYLSPFASGALKNSLDTWWKAILGNQVKPGPDGEAPTALRIQADIWYSLVTGKRDALSYAHPTSIDRRRYLLSVLKVYLPLFLTGCLVFILVLILLLLVLFSNLAVALKVTLAVGIFPLLGIAQSLLNLLGNILQTIMTSDPETSTRSIMGRIRNTTLQEEVNDGTFIPPV